MTANTPNLSGSTTRANELREDPITGRHAIIAAGRADRPAAFAPREDGAGRAGARRDQVCPFCAGNEQLTPPEIWADRDPGLPPDTPGWHIRVIPNKYPAFVPSRAGPAGTAQPADGTHEVVVHGPAHHTTLSDLPDATLIAVIDTWRARLAALRRAWPGAATVITNQGREAGASIEHSHSQIYATAFRPALVRVETERLAGQGCAACAMLRRESDQGPRLVAEHAGLVTLCPWASITPMETLLLPAGHDPSFEAGHDEPRALTRAITGILRRLRAAIGFEPALNLVLHTAPAGVEDFHWHLHAYPRLTIPAGYELGTGVMINIVDPDQAAARLRAAPMPAASPS